MKKQIIMCAVWSALLTAMLITSCEDEKEPLTVKSIQLDVTELVLYVGQEYQFKVTYEPAAAPAPRYRWEVVSGSWCTLSDDGLLKSTGEYPDELTVQVSVDNGDSGGGQTPVTAQCKVSVRMPEVELAEKLIVLRRGEQKTVDYILTPKDFNNGDVNFRVDYSYASVEKGEGQTVVFTGGTSLGESAITAYTSGGKAIAVVGSVKLEHEPVTSLEFDKAAIEGHAGTEVKLQAIIHPEYATFRRINWESSNVGVAYVWNHSEYSGEVTVRLFSPGTCTITGSTQEGGFTAAFTVTVPDIATTPYFPTEFKTLSLYEGQPQQIYVSLQPYRSDATDFPVTVWTSSDESIVTFSHAEDKPSYMNQVRATLNPQKPGEAFIYASTEYARDSCLVMVFHPSSSLLQTYYYQSASSDHRNTAYTVTLRNDNAKSIEDLEFVIYNKDGALEAKTFATHPGLEAGESVKLTGYIIGWYYSDYNYRVALYYTYEGERYRMIIASK